MKSVAVSIALACPMCQGQKIARMESRMRADNTRRRRWACTSCKYRWTSIYDANNNVIDPLHLTGQTSRPKVYVESLSEKSVLLVYSLSHKETPGSIAKKVGVSRQAIHQILTGQSHRKIGEKYSFSFLTRRIVTPPEVLAGAPETSCITCGHYVNEQCYMGFPELEEVGIWAAADCSAYLPV